MTHQDKLFLVKQAMSMANAQDEVTPVVAPEVTEKKDEATAVTPNPKKQVLGRAAGFLDDAVLAAWQAIKHGEIPE